MIKEGIKNEKHHERKTERKKRTMIMKRERKIKNIEHGKGQQNRTKNRRERKKNKKYKKEKKETK